MKVDITALNDNQALIEKLISLDDFNIILLRKGNESLIENERLCKQNEELLVENERLCKQNEELDVHVDTIKVVNKRLKEEIGSLREEIHKLTIDKHILIRKLEDLED